MKQKFCKKCYDLGHDWALQDHDRFMMKICLRCGAETYFFPPDEEIE